LSGLLLTLALYFGVTAYQSEVKNWGFAWAGLAVGLATATNYASFWLLATLSLLWAVSKTRTGRSLLQIWLGWLVGFSLGAVGWLLNVPGFLGGVASIGGAGDLTSTAKFYLKEFFSRDAGLLVVLGLAVLAALLKPHLEAWLSLSFITLVALSFILVGPHDYIRLDLLLPLIAIAAVRPLELAAHWMQMKLDDGKHNWAGDATALGLTLLVLVVSVGVRRLWHV
jgi:hypothetical protein